MMIDGGRRTAWKGETDDVVAEVYEDDDWEGMDGSGDEARPAALGFEVTGRK